MRRFSKSWLVFFLLPLLLIKSPSLKAEESRCSSGQPVMIVGGHHHTLALKDDGTVCGLGSNYSGQIGSDSNPLALAQPTTVSGIGGIRAVAAGSYFSLALDKGGRVWAWGLNQSGTLCDGTKQSRSTPAPVAGLNNVVAISAGVTERPDDMTHWLAVTSDGSVYGCGYNGNFQLGLDENQDPHGFLLTVTQITGISGVVAVAAGPTRSFALKSDGSLWAWGANHHGQLGVGQRDEHKISRPTRVRGLPRVMAAIAAGSDHALALDSDGNVWAWGSNSHGQVGIVPMGPSEYRSVPAQVGISNVVAIKAGGAFSLARKSDGSLWVWGDYGPGVSNATPRRITIREPVVQFAGGRRFFVAVTSPASRGTALATARNEASNGVVTAGENDFGQLGDGTTRDSSQIKRLNLSGIIAVSAGNDHTLALTGNGTVIAWGNNMYGQSGRRSLVNTGSPQGILGLPRILSIAAGNHHSMALAEDGTVWAWGNNDCGSLGDGTSGNKRGEPRSVPGLSNVTAIAAGQGGYASAALKSDGTVWTWGGNAVYGVLGSFSNPPNNCRLNNDSDINPHDTPYDHRTTPAQVSGLPNDIVAISAGQMHMMALRENGAVWAWGGNAYCQIGGHVPLNQSNQDQQDQNGVAPHEIPNLTNVVSIYASGRHSLVLKDDGTVWAWGYNGRANLGRAPSAVDAEEWVCSPTQVEGIPPIQRIYTARHNNLALDRDGHLWGWGTNISQSLAQDPGLAPHYVARPMIIRPGIFRGMGGGHYHSFSIGEDGEVYGWGCNYAGQAGSENFAAGIPPSLVSW